MARLDLERMIYRNPFNIPPTCPGMKIGLFGGTFNPPHAGHLHVGNTVLRKLQLDQLWWLVSPGNPLKDNNNLQPMDTRLSQCRQMNSHPDVRITAFEKGLNTRYTADTLEILTKRRPAIDFVWVMGADNLGSFHKWDRWRTIADIMPLVVVDRPGSTVSPNSTPATHTLSKYRMDERDAKLLAGARVPAWTFIHAPRSFLSSTRIRNTG